MRFKRLLALTLLPLSFLTVSCNFGYSSTGNSYGWDKDLMDLMDTHLGREIPFIEMSEYNFGFKKDDGVIFIEEKNGTKDRTLIFRQSVLSYGYTYDKSKSENGYSYYYIHISDFENLVIKTCFNEQGNSNFKGFGIYANLEPFII